MGAEEEEEDFTCLATQKEQNEFVKLCGYGKLKSVELLLANDHSLIKARSNKKLNKG